MKFLLLLLLLILSLYAGIETHPYMYLDTDNPERSIFIHWQGGEGTVHYGIDNYEQTISGTDFVHLKNLTKHGRYQWYLEVDGEQSEMGSFQLEPGVMGKGFRIALFGDTQYMDKNVDSFFVYAEKQKPELLIILGDYVTRDNTQYIGWGDEIRHLINKYPLLFANSILVPVMGNHDYQGSSAAAQEADIKQYFMPYFPNIPATLDPTLSEYQQIGRNYALDYGPITFSVNYGYGAQGWTYEGLESYWTDYLDKRIDDNTLRPFVIALSHYDREYRMSKYFGPVYQDRRGLLWYNGETHLHIRTDWRRIDASGGIESESETQESGHMIYCHAGHPARESNKQKRMSIVDVTSEGVVYHNQYELADADGEYDDFYPLTDSFTVDASDMVDEYCESHDCVGAENIAYVKADIRNKIGVSLLHRSMVEFDFMLRSNMMEEKITVDILSLSGQKIASFENPKATLQGKGKVLWNAESCASGRYVIRIASASHTITESFSLIR